MSKREPPVAAQDRNTPTPTPSEEPSVLEVESSPRRSTTLQWNPSIALSPAAPGDMDKDDNASISGARRVLGSADANDAPAPGAEPAPLPLSELRPEGGAPSRATLPSAIDTPPSTLTRAEPAALAGAHATPVVPSGALSGRTIEAPTPPSTRLFGSPPSSRRASHPTPPPLPKVPGAMPPRSLTPGPRPAARSLTPNPGNAHPTPRSLSPMPRRDDAITPLRPSAVPEVSSADADPRGTKNPALRATGFSGLSQGVPLSHWLELVQIGRRDAVISLRTKNGDESHIWCRQGEIVDAQTGSLLGEDAVYRILDLEDGDVSIEFTPCERPKTIATPTFALMLEASRRKDHAAESSGPRPVPQLGDRATGENTPVSRPSTGSMRARDPRSSMPLSDAVVSSTGAHIRSYDPASLPPPSSMQSSTQWKHPRAFGAAFALVFALLGLWLLWSPGGEPARPAAKPVPAPVARPAPAPTPKRAPAPAATAAPAAKAELASEPAPAPSAASEEPVAAAPPRPEPVADSVERRAPPARARRAVHTPPPAPPRPAQVKEVSASEPSEPPPAPADTKKEEPRVRLIDERKPRVQVIDELPPDVRVID